MKRVLILAYDFPPLLSAGAARPYGWYLYMKKYGLEPVVVTRNWTENMQSEYEIMQSRNPKGTEIEHTEFGTLIKVDYIPNARDRWSLRKQGPVQVLIRKVLSGLSQYLPFMTFRDDATRNLYHEADQYISANPTDLILATGGPFHLFRYASLLSRKHGIPWYADFRDLWSYYPNHGLGFMDEVVHKQVKRRFENRSVRTAAGIVAVTKPCAEILEKAHQKPVFLSLNGYINYSGSKPVGTAERFGKLKIAYIGTLYDYYPLEDFFEGFNQAVQKGSTPVSLTFIGMDFYPEQRKKIQQLAGDSIANIEFTGKLNAQALQETLQNYDVLLLFGKENGLSIHIKLFEYLLLSKPILLFGKNNEVMGNIIKDTSSGHICGTAKDLASLLDQLSAEKREKGFLHQEIQNIEKYSREFQTEKLVQFLKEHTAAI